MNSENISKIITYAVLGIVIIAVILLLFTRGDNATLELKGLTEMVIYQNDRYVEPGYKIVNSNSTNGFYVNLDGYVNTNKTGIYYLKYLLYNKKGVLVSEATRRVIVLEDTLTNVKMYLKGEDEEYHFINEYIDNGVEVYQNGIDISNLVMVESNIDASTIGQYEVKYQVKINNSIKELKRIVNIIDYDIKMDIDTSNLSINLLISCQDFDYVLLPNGIKDYSKKISYNYNNITTYEFDIYLKSGSHKKYIVDMSSIDKDGPVGTCNLYHDNGRTTITMNVADNSGISKYSYNGLDFYNNSTIINSIITNVTVRAYDKENNYTDIKCKSEYGTGFRNISVNAKGIIQNKKDYIVCGTSVSKASQELDLLMQSYGYKTRDAVAAAGVYLATYEYDIPYFWGGKSTTKGLDPEWGCRHSHTTEHPCTKPLNSDYSYCKLGLDCAGFTRWAYIQAGFDKSILRGSEQSEGMWGNFNARTHRYAFNSQNRALANQIKPGDIVHKPGHVGLVIGVSAEQIQVAEMKGPIIIDIINKSNGASVNEQSNFEDFVLMDDFFKMYGN